MNLWKELEDRLEPINSQFRGREATDSTLFDISDAFEIVVAKFLGVTYESVGVKAKFKEIEGGGSVYLVESITLTPQHHTAAIEQILITNKLDVSDEDFGI